MAFTEYGAVTFPAVVLASVQTELLHLVIHNFALQLVLPTDQR